MFRAFVDNSGLLAAGAAIALIWANAGPSGYLHAAVLIRFAVNDVGMALFFALAAKEVVEAMAPGGALHSPRRSALPVVAAVGGMLGPALIYIGLVAILDRPDLARGWAIPCATDIAFSYLAARLILGPTHPAIPFLLLLAIADDALGLVILAVAYPAGIVRPLEFAVLLCAACTIAWLLRSRRIHTFWPYIAGAGAVSWLAFYRGGLHPALALVPIVPFLPRAGRDAFDALGNFERAWKRPVQLILFFFGLANAGVTLNSVGVGTWVVLAAILIGKPVGILTATGLSTAAGLRFPSGVTWRDMTVVGVMAGIGFTVALFFATAAFPAGAPLNEAKMGALFSASAALLAAATARVLRVPRLRP